MQNIIKTIEKQAIMAFSIAIMVGVIIIPTFAKADTDYGYYDYYESSNYDDSNYYDYYESSNYDNSYNDYYESSNYGDYYDYYESSNYDDSSYYDYYESSNYDDSYDYYESSNYSDSAYNYDYYESSNYNDSNYYNYYGSTSYVDDYNDNSGYYEDYTYYEPIYADSYDYDYNYGSNYNYGNYGSNYGYNYNSGYNYNTGCTRNCNPPIVDNTVSLSVTCPTSGTYEIGQSVTWRANASGGTGSYTYSWSGDASGTGSSVQRAYNSEGTKSATVTVRSGSRTATASCSVFINEEDEDNLGGYCEATPSNPEEGDTVTWKATGTGGNGSYTYSWSGDVSGNSRTETETYNSTGTKRGTVRITSGNQSITRSCDVHVDNDNNNNDDDFSAICRVSDTSVRVGERVTFTADIEDGNSPYDITWSGDIDGDNRTETHTFNRAGRYDVRLSVRDDDGNRETDDCPVIVVEDDNNNGNVTLLQTPGTGTLSSGVFLSQIPYTGAAENMKVALFVFGVALWSALIAYIIIKKKAAKGGTTQRDMIEKFKQANLARKNQTIVA